MKPAAAPSARLAAPAGGGRQPPVRAVPLPGVTWRRLYGSATLRPAAGNGGSVPEFLTFGAIAGRPAQSDSAEELPPSEAKGGEAVLDRAERTIAAARAALEVSRTRTQPPPEVEKPKPPSSSGLSRRRYVPKLSELEPKDDAPPPSGGGGGRFGGGGDMPSWASDMLPSSAGGGAMRSDGPQLKAAPKASLPAFPETMFAEEPAGMLEMLSQEEMDMRAASMAKLPPLQSVLELTSAARPPERGAEGAAPTMAGATAAAKAMADGKGRLADGTMWEKTSGEEFGELGFRKRWTTIKGVSSAGRVEWEETWWEASDWTGMRELAAEKTGCAADGSAWREFWSEHLSHLDTGEPRIERRASKWSKQGGGEEWEENWGETYQALGQVNKYADKWAKSGSDIWHEKWGEEYDGRGWCKKYTDKWAERELLGGAREQWGDKWEEEFGDGSGGKRGETWNIDAGGNAYNKYWGEDHYGDGRVRKHGSSNTGEHWDLVEHMDTYYNPIPHFGWHHAWGHSPQLRNVPERPRDTRNGGGGDDLGSGFGAL
mmetsp:Transcript_682/g.1680  ORF Transcript_682/g.1680 Transcript_682/m.1680 type:complete len:543 (+) Transcript_682:164-1792(+)